MTARVHPRTPAADGAMPPALVRARLSATVRLIRFEDRPAEGGTFTVELPFARLPIHSIRRVAA